MYQNQWLKWDGNYYYLRSWGGAAHEGWLLLQNKYYYINEDCTRKTDEAFTYDNNLYFVDENGVMPANQWVIREGVWYFTYSWGGARKSQWFYYKTTGITSTMMLPCRPAGQKLTEKHIISRAGADASPGRKN